MSSDAEKGLEEKDARHHKNCRNPWVFKMFTQIILMTFYIVFHISSYTITQYLIPSDQISYLTYIIPRLYFTSI